MSTEDWKVVVFECNLKSNNGSADIPYTWS